MANYGTHFGLLTGTPSEHVEAASIQLQADEILSDLFSTVEAFGAAFLLNDGDGYHSVPSFDAYVDIADGRRLVGDYIAACRCDDGYLLRVHDGKGYGLSRTMVVTYDQANKVC